MDKLQAMRAFVRVVEAGTFTRAADSLGLPKATVTKLVQGLEARLRVKLLQRTTRRVTVTADGAAYYERAARLLGDLDDIEASVANAQSLPRGTLRIDIAAAPARLVLLPALSGFLARYPDLRVNIGVTDRPVDLIGENVDCVIRGGDLSDQSLVARRIALLSSTTCAAPAYLERHGTPEHPHELEDGHLIVTYMAPRTGRTVPLHFVRGSENFVTEGNHRVSVNESTAHVVAAVAGLGLIQTPTFMARPHLDRGELVAVLPDWQPPPIPLYLVYPPNRYLSSKLRVFMEWAAELFGGLE